MNKKKMQIIDVAHQLFLKNGFGQTSIQDILDEAKIAKGTFYKYFKSKNECLIAILELVKQESDQKRKELLIGKPIDDEEVFVEQILIRLDTDKEYNLMALFMTTSFMTDPELSNFMVKMHLNEVQWIARRLIDLYGAEVKDIATDQAVIFLGILQHTFQVAKMASIEDLPDKKAILFAFKQLKPLIEQQMSEEERMFPIHLIPFDEEGEPETLQKLSEQASNQIETLLKQQIPNEETELLEFLATELKIEKPRILLVESIWRTLSQTEANHKYKELLLLLTEFIQKSREH